MASDATGLPSRLQWTLSWQTRKLMPLLDRPETDGRLRDFWTRARRMEAVRRTVRLGPSSLIVDVGAGLTTPLRWLPGRRLAVDPLARQYAASCAPSLPRCRYVAASGEHLPLAERVADLVICTNCIDHTEDPWRVMREMFRVAKVGAHLWFSCEVNPPDLARNAGHPHALDREAIAGLVSAFEVCARWEEPWRGVYGHLLDRPPFPAVELGFLLRKGASR